MSQKYVWEIIQERGESKSRPKYLKDATNTRDVTEGRDKSDGDGSGLL